jgi:hypothetical protein
MQTKRQPPKSCRTNHKTSDNAMEKWRNDGKFTTHHHIFRAFYLGPNKSDICLDIGLVLSYIQSIELQGNA